MKGSETAQMERDGDTYWSPQGTITPAMRTAAKVAITDELSRLSLEEIPHEELVLRAEDIRHRIFAPEFLAQQEQGRRQRAVEQQHRAEEKRRDALRELGLARAKHAALARGMSSAALVLLEAEVDERLQVLLTGLEHEDGTLKAIDALVEALLAQWEADQKRAQAARRARVAGEVLDAAQPILAVALPRAAEKLREVLSKAFGWGVPPDAGFANAQGAATDGEPAARPQPDTAAWQHRLRRRRVYQPSPASTDSGRSEPDQSNTTTAPGDRDPSLS